MPAPSPPVVHLFTDIEGSTRLWEEQPERMRPALARHDVLLRAAVAEHGGSLVKTTGDGIHAAFDDAAGALAAALAIQHGLAAPAAADAIRLNVRCGMHAGQDERRDGDFYGQAVNRAARVMSAAHGGQVLLTQAVADLAHGRLPAGASLRPLGAVRLRDLARPEPVLQLLHPELRADFPALRSLENTPNNLKQQLTSFINRQRELADIRRLLGETRLLTLLGMGGLGKSRLSVQVAAEVLDDYPDGVWLVELAAVADAESVPRALAQVLGVREEPGRPVTEALQRHVRDRRMLIVLDNCEHVLTGGAELSRRLLEAGAQLRVMASSRHALGVSGETVYPVPPLTVPRPQRDEPPSPGELLQLDSVRLFVERARSVQPGFRLDAGNAAAVAEISRKLDGIPLAIELAAARARALPVQAVAARLEDRFRLLTTGDSTLPARQRTLRALIDWSYDLLSEAERIAFRRLAVFAGGWTIEAAEAVAGGEPLLPDDVLDLLAQLADKSLVVLEPESGRYRMLDTVRQYALERLHAAGDEAAARDRHLHHFVAFAEAARPQLLGPEQGEWLRRVDLDRENLLAAHAWCDHTPDGAGPGLRLVFSLKFYWLNRGMLAVGHQAAQKALARRGALARDAARSRGLFDFGQICCFMGRYEEAMPLLQESLAIARELDDRARIAAVLQPLGMAAIGVGELDLAQDSLEEAVRLARQQASPRQLAAATNALAQLLRMRNQPSAARSLYEEALALSQQQGDQESVAIGLLNMAMIEISNGNVANATSKLLDALHIATATASKAVGQSALEVTSGWCAARGEVLAAARLLGAAETQAQRSGIRRDAADEAFLRPLLQTMTATQSAAELEDARAEGRLLGFDAALREATALLSAATRS